MNKFKKLSIGQQVLPTFGSLCAVLFLLGGLIYFGLQFLERSNGRQLRATHELALIDDTAQDVGQMQADVLRQVLASDAAKILQLDQTIRDIAKINAGELAAYRQFVDTNEERQLYDRVIQARKAYWQQTQPVLALSRADRDNEATALINSRQAPAYDALLQATNELIKYVEADANKTARATSSFISAIRMIGDALVGVTMLITIGAGFAVSGVIRQLKKDNQLLQIEVIERKQAEDALRKSEDKFRQLADNITDVFWITSPDFQTIHFVSAGYQEIWGRSPESLYAHPHQWIEAILPEERERAFATFATLMANAPEVSVEYQIARPDGTVRWVHDRGFQVLDSAGKLVRLAGIASDITERKRAGESLRLLGSAVEQSKESILITDAELDLPGPRIIFANPAFTKMTGYTAAEVIGKTPRILQGPQTDKTVLSRLRQNLGRGEPFDGETVNYRKDGTEFELEWQVAPIRNPNGTITHFVAIHRDVTERNRIEARFHRLVDSNAQGVIFWSTNGEITQANDAFLNLVGYTREDLESGHINWMALTPPEYAHLDRRCLEEVAAHGVSAPYEKEYLRKDGSRVPILLGAASFEDTADEGVCFFLDLTERKRLEAQLLQSQKMETVGKLAGGIAHEFNSILTAIIGQSELLLGDLPAESPLAKSATEIQKAAERAAILTRQLLAYGRKQILKPEVLDLNSVLAGMESTLRHLIGRGTDLVLALDGVKSVKADAGQVEQVTMNLVINAHDAMPNGGRLMLETGNVSFDEESVGRDPELPPGDYVMLAITDTGTGMNEEVRARVFEPFFSTKGVGLGSGLGLSTCYGIVKQSGGHISVYSELGRGTTFKVYLPQVAPLTDIPVPRFPPPALPGGTETILLVEDDPALREMAASLLRRLGYTVLAAANGVEALSLRQQRDVGHIDLLFTDVVMPHMSGKELADRARVLYPHTRILFTSAYTENTMAYQGVLDKGVALLQKPFTPSALANKLREVLDRPDLRNSETAEVKT